MKVCIDGGKPMPRVSAYTKIDPAEKERVKRHEFSTVIPVTVLQALYEGPQTFTASDLAARAGVYKSNIYRWLYTFEKIGWVERYETIRTVGPREQVWRRVHRLQPIEPSGGM